MFFLFGQITRSLGFIIIGFKEIYFSIFFDLVKSLHFGVSMQDVSTFKLGIHKPKGVFNYFNSEIRRQISVFF